MQWPEIKFPKYMPMIGIYVSICIYYLFLAFKPVQWGDSGFFLSRIIEGPYVLISLHPLAHHLFQFAYKCIYALFGLYGILAFGPLLLLLNALLLFAIAARSGLEKSLAAWVPLLFVLAHSVIWNSSHMEVYLLHNALLLASVYCLLRNNFLVGGLLFGSSLSTHQLSTLASPVFAFFLVTRGGWKALLLFTTATFGGLVILFPSFYHYIMKEGLSFYEAALLHLTGKYGSNPGWSEEIFDVNGSLTHRFYLIVALFSFLSPISLGFLLKPGKDPAYRMILALLIVFLAFVVFYDINDRFTFLLPALSFLTLAAGKVIHDRHWRPAFVLPFLLLPFLFSGFFLIAREPLFGNVQFQNHGFRDEVIYYGLPWIKENSAGDFARHYRASLPPHATIYTFHSLYGALASAKATDATADYSLAILKKQLEKNGERIYIPAMQRLDTAGLHDLRQEAIGFSAVYK